MKSNLIILLLLIVIPSSLAIEFGTNDRYWIDHAIDVLYHGTYYNLLELRRESGLYLLPEVNSVNEFIKLQKHIKRPYKYVRLDRFNYDPYLHVRSHSIPRYNYRNYYHPLRKSPYYDYGFVRRCSRNTCVWTID